MFDIRLPNGTSNGLAQVRNCIDAGIVIAFRQPPRFAPGAQFENNNTNSLLLGAVVDQVTGQPIRDYVHEHILEPVGLTHTSFPVRTEHPAPSSGVGVTYPFYLPSQQMTLVVLLNSCVDILDSVVLMQVDHPGHQPGQRLTERSHIRGDGEAGRMSHFQRPGLKGDMGRFQ